VDVLFDSMVKEVGKHATGVILTGMGADGAPGLLRMREAGSHTIGQDEASSVVYGMPRAARELGAVEFELPLCKVASKMLRLSSKPKP
jgi:two-component system chemotaxis response regulator CheB